MGENMRNRKSSVANEVFGETDELYGGVIEGDKENISLEDSLVPASKQFSASNVGGDLGVLAYVQALQNMNLLTQDLMRKSMGTTSNNSITADEIRGIVKTVVSEIMKELGAKVE